jgi:hypothetical protein
VDELSTFFEIAWEKYPRHFAVILLGSVTGLRPSSLYALRRCGPEADVKWDQGLVLIRRSRGIKGRVPSLRPLLHPARLGFERNAREHGRWPESVRSYDYVTLADEELDAMADHGTWPDRLG